MEPEVRTQIASAKMATTYGTMAPVIVAIHVDPVKMANFWSTQRHAWKIRAAKGAYIFRNKKLATALDRKAHAPYTKWSFSILLLGHQLTASRTMVSAVVLALYPVLIRNALPTMWLRIRATPHQAWLNWMANATSYTLGVLADQDSGWSRVKYWNETIVAVLIANAVRDIPNMKRRTELADVMRPALASQGIWMRKIIDYSCLAKVIGSVRQCRNSDSAS